MFQTLQELLVQTAWCWQCLQFGQVIFVLILESMKNLLLQCYYVCMRKKCPYSEFFFSVFSRIRTKYGEIVRISPYSFRMRKIRTRKTPNTDTFHAVCVYVYVFLNTFPGNISLLYQWKQRFFREFCTETEHCLEMGCYLRVNDNKGLWFLLCSKPQRNRNGFEFLVNILKIED